METIYLFKPSLDAHFRDQNGFIFKQNIILDFRYRAFRDETGQYLPIHWKILALKLAFVIVFEVSMNLIQKIVKIVKNSI